jgi:hypothetical protein
MQFRSTRCAFLGYSNLHKGYKCLDISSGCVCISRNVVFDEVVFPFAELPSSIGAHYTAEVLLIPQNPGLDSDSPVHDFPTNLNTIPRLVLSSYILQPQMIQTPAPARDMKSRGILVLGLAWKLMLIRYQLLIGLAWKLMLIRYQLLPSHVLL